MRQCWLALLAGLLAHLAVVFYFIYSVGQQPTHLFNSTDEIIRAAGYPCEIHNIQTEDGYILTAFRIPYTKNNKTGPRPPFWLQHGLTGSSDQYVHLGPGKSLAFILADNGYDVWIGNSRGNRYSQKNIHFKPDNPQFWDFSWDEMGNYDLPAEIGYVLSLTKQKIYYAGHSMGTAIFMVFLTKHPEFQDKVELVFGLAPAVFMGNSRSIVFKFFCGFYSRTILSWLGPSPILPSTFTQLQNWIWPKCSPDHKFSVICEKIYTLTGGPSTHLNPDILPIFMSTNPSQTSAKALAHYGQSIETGEFRAFNYSEKGNLERYGHPEPPAYDLGSIKTPVVIMFSDHDDIVTPSDEYKLCLSLTNVVEFYRVPQQKFSHFDFLYSTTTKELIYDKIIQTLSQGQSFLKARVACKYIDIDG